MLPVINLFGINIASYSACILIGIFIGAILSINYFSKFNDVDKDDVINCICFAIIGMLFCSKLLYIITSIPNLIDAYKNLGIKIVMENIFQGGFVFYGGLIGILLGIFIYSKFFKISFKKLLLTIIPVIPLAHCIGRIGCFLAGCCYGIEYTGFGHIIFHNTMFAPTNIQLFPIQLLESFCNLIIFVLLTITYKKNVGTYKTITLYCILYSIVRFSLEFLRGDLIRGIWLNLSTSQWISIIIFILGIFVYNIKTEKNIEKSEIYEK